MRSEVRSFEIDEITKLLDAGVSTLGDYYPARNGPRDTVAGPREFFESMVFATAINGKTRHGDGCGCRPVLDFGNPLATERYQTAGGAHLGHEILVARFAERAAKSLEVL